MFENNLYVIRMQNSMTQKEFAEELGMTAGNYSRYERGENDIPLSLAKKIALIFDVSIDEIAGLEEPDYEAAAEGRAFLVESEEEEEERIREIVRDEIEKAKNKP